MENDGTNPAILELELTQFSRMVADLRRESQAMPAKCARVRLRVTANAFIIEEISLDAQGRQRITRVRRLIIRKQKMTKSRPRYTKLREPFEAAAAKYRVKPSTLSAHRRKKSAAIAAYWKQPPVE